MSLVLVSATLVATSVANAQSFDEEPLENVSEDSTASGFEIPPPLSAPEDLPAQPSQSTSNAFFDAPSAGFSTLEPASDNAPNEKDAESFRSNSKPSGPKDLKLSREQLNAVFQGDLSSLPSAEKLFPPSASFGTPPSFGQNDLSGGMNSFPSEASSFRSPAGMGVPPISSGFSAANGTTVKRSPEQSLAIMVAEVEKQIARHNRELNESTDDAQQEVLLKKLSESYQLRFELDTAFQDYKVAEIERRAKKLRADVDAREKATQQWVDAMVTLAKMKANGIETMNSTPSSFDPTPALAPAKMDPAKTFNVPPSGRSSY